MKIKSEKYIMFETICDLLMLLAIIFISPNLCIMYFVYRILAVLKTIRNLLESVKCKEINSNFTD